MVLFIFLLAFFLLLGFTAPQLGNTTSGTVANTSFNSLKTEMNKITTSINQTYYLPILGSIPFPNVFGVFSGTFNLLVSLLRLPGDMIGSLIGLPEILRLALSLLINILMGLAILTWYKGQSQ